MKPWVIVNFKDYDQATGKKAIALAKKCKSVAAEVKGIITVCPTTTDLRMIKKIPVFAQHVDPTPEGAHTGHVSAAHLKKIGCKGSLINHSERPLKFEEIKKTIKMCKKNGLISVVCAANLKTIKKVVKLKPTAIAYEPPKLISSKTSVTNTNPNIIKKAHQITKGKTSLLVGAGIHTQKDVKTALKLGAIGVLVASAIVKAKNQKKIIKQMLNTTT